MDQLPIPKLKNLDLSKLSNEELSNLVHELEALKKKTPLDYQPHAKQKLFHDSPAQVRFMSGGNRSGKTESGIWEDVAHATGLYPTWFSISNRFNGPTRGRIIVTDYAKGGDTVEKKIWEWLPKELVVSIRRTNKGALERIEVKHKSGGTSTIEILTHEQEDMAFEGWSGHWAHFDEPPPREKFIATRRGLIDFAGRCWLTLTPLNEPWLYDEFVSKADNDKDIFFLVVDIWDNAKSRGGYLPDQEIIAFEKVLLDEEKEARIHGRFRHLTGLVYKMFDPSVHCISKNKIKIEPKWPKYFVCDPHDRKPHFGIWATVDPVGTVYVIGEIKFKGTIQEFARQIYLRELMDKELGIKPQDVIRIGDPNKMNTPSAVNGLKLKEEFAKYNVCFITDVNDDIVLGHLAVSEKLSYNKTKPLSFGNKPKLYFLKENCPEVIRYMQLYVWDDWKGSAKDTRSQREKPQEKFKDFPDCLRYLIVYNPTFFIEESDPVSYRGNSTTGY